MLSQPTKVREMWDTWLHHEHGLCYLNKSTRGSWDGMSVATSRDGVHYSEIGPIVPRREDAEWLGTECGWETRLGATPTLAGATTAGRRGGVEPPPAGRLLRELLYMGHYIHSHTLSLFVLEGPDLVLGLDADPRVRNVVGVVAAAPEVAKQALRLRTLGQRICETVGGRGTHPVTSVAGGIAFRLDSENEAQLRAWTDEAAVLVTGLAATAKQLLFRLADAHPDVVRQWVVPAWGLGTVRNGRVNLYDGLLRQVDETGASRGEWSSNQYDTRLSERVLDWSYMKPVVIRHEGQEHPYRVGPLARLNCADGMATPLAHAELEEWKAHFGWPCHATVFQTYARVVELVYACERAREILADPAIHGETRVPVKFRGSRGVGHVEAPRGTLIHDYTIDENGIVREANLLVATQQNYELINRFIEQAAKSHVTKPGDEPLLNAVEFAIRCYDPCLSCATHAVGAMPLEIEVRQGGRVVRHAGRG